MKPLKPLRPLNPLKTLTMESAPDGAKAGLAIARKRRGFISNLMATMGNSPPLLNGYVALTAAWEKVSLTARERELVLLAASVENKCLYCIAAHATRLADMRTDAGLVGAVRRRTPLADPRLDALVVLTRELVNGRGFVSEQAKERFIAAGYDEIVLMEILLGVALKTISNYFDHLNPVSIDAAFQEHAHAG